MADSGSTLPAALSDADAQLLKCYGRNITQDVVGVLTESIFCSECLAAWDCRHSSSGFTGAYGIFFALAVYSILY
jgi:hypothetical protein